MTTGSLRLGILMPYSQWQGGTQVAVTLAEAFRELGVEVSLAAIFPISTDSPPWNQEIAAATHLDAGSLPLAVIRTRTWMRRGNFDVLLAIGDWASMVAGLSRHCLRRSPNVVVGSEHFHISPKFGSSESLKSGALGKLMRLAYRSLDGSICVNEELQIRMSNELGWEIERCPVIPNPVRLPIRKAAEVELDVSARRRDGNEYVVATACALEPRKDVATLLRAFARASKNLPMRLLIAGDGEELEQQQLLAKHLGIESRVKFLGVIRDMRQFLADVDVFVFSTKADAFGLVLIEALSQGVPVVSTVFASGHARGIVDSTVGRLVPVGDQDAMADQIVDVLLNPPDRTKVIERARRFERKRIAALYLEYFANLLSGNPRKVRL